MTEIAHNIMNKFQYNSIMQVPKIKKVTLSIGVGESSLKKRSLDLAISDLMLISGQKPKVTKAKKSIAGFKIRQNDPIGCKVTLRKSRMWDFLDRLIYIAIPRIRDFRGLSTKSFDGTGNYNIGIKEQIIFPEVDYDKIDKIRGLCVSIITTTLNDKICLFLLRSLKFPFRK
ncbi:50S ribosomal protein L5 [Candidatus Riesia sp. GBBU]|nr:50S ribosomal protein L5 [Candidatus Riesia sp. GBBU]